MSCMCVILYVCLARLLMFSYKNSPVAHRKEYTFGEMKLTYLSEYLLLECAATKPNRSKVNLKNVILGNLSLELYHQSTDRSSGYPINTKINMKLLNIRVFTPGFL